jgi:hypothetical protein
MSQSVPQRSKRNSHFERILRRMSPDVAATLTPTQLAELQSAFQSMQPGKHAIDLRVSIPFPGRGFYFVFLAGRERRSVERLRAENPHYLYHSALAILVLTGVLAALVVPAYLWLLQLNTEQNTEPAHPTAIPWLQDQQSCEKTGREWQEGKCWEREWSHMF